jgi:hypothetical protein
MFDVTMLALVIVCFALAAAYASLCEDLLGPSPGKDVSPIGLAASRSIQPRS